MPSPKKFGHTKLLVQVPDAVHTTADARRRRESITWAKVIATLLQRWAAGDELALAKGIRVSRPATPEAEDLARVSAEWMKDPEYRRAATEKVDITQMTRYPSLGALLAADAAKAGRVMPGAMIAEADAEDAADTREAFDE